MKEIPWSVSLKIKHSRRSSAICKGSSSSLILFPVLDTDLSNMRAAVTCVIWQWPSRACLPWRVFHRVIITPLKLPERENSAGGEQGSFRYRPLSVLYQCAYGVSKAFNPAGHASAVGWQHVLSSSSVPLLRALAGCKRSQLPRAGSEQLWNVHSLPVTPHTDYLARREVVWGGHYRFLLPPSAKWSRVPFPLQESCLVRGSVL